MLKSCSCGSTSFLALGYPLTAMLEGATAGIALELFYFHFYFVLIIFLILFCRCLAGRSLRHAGPQLSGLGCQFQANTEVLHCG